MTTPREIADFVLSRVDHETTVIADVLADATDEEISEAEQLLLPASDVLETVPGSLDFQRITAFQLLLGAEDRRDAGRADDDDDGLADWRLSQEGWQALAAGDTRAADAITQQLLDRAGELPADHWDRDNLVHHGHSLRGHVRLREGDEQGAAEELVASGDLTGSPQLDSFGPDFSLAWELLKLGRDEAVLRFLHDVSRFWSPTGSSEPPHPGL